MLLDRHSLKYQIPKLEKQNAQSPGTEEQTQIAAFLSALDDRISVKQNH